MPKFSPAFPPRRPSSALRYALAALFLIFIFYYLDFGGGSPAYIAPPPPSNPQAAQDPVAPIPGAHHEPPANAPKEPETVPEAQSPQHDAGEQQEHMSAGANENEEGDAAGAKPPPPPDRPQSFKHHPIDDLIEQAENTFSDMMHKESKTVGAAASAYRARRGRHPPPGFEDWFDFAQKHNAVLVEDFFDQIYHDLEPFWGLEPSFIRKEAASYEMFITVRDGTANTTSDWFWTQIWLDMIQKIEHLLPDMDIALNPMDEPRIIVPFEHMEKHMEKAAYTKHMERPQDVVGSYQDLPIKKKVEPHLRPVKKKFEETEPYWRHVRQACTADSPARTAPLQTDFDLSPSITTEMAQEHLHEGYVSNSSHAKELCHQPDLQGLNGIFIEPQSISTCKTLFPMFGGSKLSVNSEILLPAPMYWEGDERFMGGDFRGGPWSRKEDGVVWRGVATGGRNRETNWKGFQRHRFVSMNNETMVETAAKTDWKPINFALPERAYNIAAQAAGKLGEWIHTFANVAFTNLMCEPDEEEGTCAYTGPFFMVSQGVMMGQQFTVKYLPDIDGNSFSGRYLGFLKSTSVPIKATVWREWHDSRLVAWKHFVPMDSRFSDYYGIVQYFLGYGEEVPAHDAEGERIAKAGKEWAEKALRKEDMLIYTLRLLLEYARVSDNRREQMGYVNDLLAESVSDSDESV